MRTCLTNSFIALFTISIVLLSGCDLNPTGSSGRLGSPNYSDISKENKSRDVWQKPSVVIGTLGDISDKTIADIGAGTGYFTFRMAINAKKVIAIDIDNDMIELIDAFKLNLPSSMSEKIETRLATPKNSNLKPNEADVIVMINTLSYIEDKYSYLRRLMELLPQEGQLMVVDYKHSSSPQSLEHGPYSINDTDLKTLLNSTGFDSVEINNDMLEYQYIANARK